jgi:predicted metal-dependent hydrolase
LTLPPLESLAEAQRLLDVGRPFHAHEVLEGTWKAAPPNERDFWQGLAQLAVGLTHALRGNATGATSVLTRGRDRLALYADDPPYGVDVAGLVAWSNDLLGRLAAADRTDAAPSDKTPLPLHMQLRAE